MSTDYSVVGVISDSLKRVDDLKLIRLLCEKNQIPVPNEIENMGDQEGTFPLTYSTYHEEGITFMEVDVIDIPENVDKIRFVMRY